MADDVTPVFDPASSAALSVRPLVGALIASRRPGVVIGWLFLGAGQTLVAGATYGYAAYALFTQPQLPGGLAAAWLTSWPFPPSVFAVPPLMYLLSTETAATEPPLVVDDRSHRHRAGVPGGRCGGQPQPDG